MIAVGRVVVARGWSPDHPGPEGAQVIIRLRGWWREWLELVPRSLRTTGFGWKGEPTQSLWLIDGGIQAFLDDKGQELLQVRSQP
eukprot:1140889-Pelagomonas_calceolata.AAC.2